MQWTLWITTGEKGRTFDYDWEERWIRDEGFMKIVPQAVSAVLESAGRVAAEIDHFILPTDQARTPAALGRNSASALMQSSTIRSRSVGVAGAAQPLILLAKSARVCSAGTAYSATWLWSGLRCHSVSDHRQN